MSVVFGIYIGNSTCSVAVNKDGKVDVVANDAGERVTPAVVCVQDDEVVTGLAAKQGLMRNGPRTILSVLKAISIKDSSEYKNGNNSTACSPTWDDDGDVSYIVPTDSGNRPVQAVNVLRHIFKQLKDITSRHNSSEQCTTCLCLPAWVSKKAVNITRDAAKQAGFKVVGIVLQPTAASLAYKLLQDRMPSCIAVTLHLGETSSVGGVLEVSGGLATVRDITSSSMRPGCTITNKLVEYLAKEFFQKYKGDPLENKRSRQKLYNQAEAVKHILSSRPTAQVSVDSLWEGVDFNSNVSRARFEGLISSTLTEIIEPTLVMLQRLDISPSQVNKVLLSGGTCKIPRLQQRITETFSSAEVLFTIPPDEVLAYGAAIEAEAVTASYGNGTTNGNLTNKATAGGKKKKTAARKEAVRSHVPVMVSALSVSVWAKVDGSESSACCLPRLTPPHLRHTASLALTPQEGEGDVTLNIYEANTAVQQEEVPQDALLAQLKVPVTQDSKEISISCLLKPDSSLHLNVSEAVSKFTRKFVIGAVQEDDSS